MTSCIIFTRTIKACLKVHEVLTEVAIVTERTDTPEAIGKVHACSVIQARVWVAIVDIYLTERSSVARVTVAHERSISIHASSILTRAINNALVDVSLTILTRVSTCTAAYVRAKYILTSTPIEAGVNSSALINVVCTEVSSYPW